MARHLMDIHMYFLKVFEKRLVCHILPPVPQIIQETSIPASTYTSHEIP